MSNEQLSPKKKVVLINLDERVIEMADEMKTVHDAESFSAYVRKVIRADYRRHQRRIARQEKVSSA